jgi:hypothetical protein
MAPDDDEVEEVAPLIDVPSFFHWYVNGDVPLAVTEKLAELPAVTEVALGWVVIDGAVASAVIVRLAALLVELASELDTTTE